MEQKDDEGEAKHWVQL